MTAKTRVVTPQRWSDHGEAVARHTDGRLVSVWAGIPGEAAHASLVHAGRNKIQARFEAPAAGAHEGRRAPPCNRFSGCGGCPMMHLEPDWQRRARRAAAKAAFRAEGLEDLVPADVVPSPDGDEEYRHVVKLSAGRSDHGNMRLGAYMRGSHHVLPIPTCTVATPQLREAMKVVSHHFIDLDVHPYDEQTETGTLRHVVMRQSRANGQILVTLVVTRIDKRVRALADRIMGGLGAVAGVAAHINDQPGNAIFAPAPEPEEEGEEPRPPFKRLAGSPVIEDTLAGVRLRIGPGDFFQANPGMADRIATDLVELLAEWKERPFVDLYCGVGGFALVGARAHGWALGAEVVPGAVFRATENAQLNHLPAEFVHGRIADLVPGLVERLGDRAPVIMLDPARRGLEKGVIEGVIALKPAAVAYLSCNPRAMARDLRRFKGLGWTVQETRAYDMFPQTTHLEMLALLLPPEAPEPARRAPRRRVVR
jgi:23S rRNA (uracil1939-C5)-methyltransferase